MSSHLLAHGHDPRRWIAWIAVAVVAALAFCGSAWAMAGPLQQVPGTAELPGEAPASTAAATQGLGPGATVPSWAAGKRIHFFASPNGAFGPGGGLTEQGSGGIGAGHRNLGRRCGGGYCPLPPLIYHEGKGVQHAPTVYVIFWGKNWEKAPGAEVKSQLLAMYKGLSGSAWQGILTQYFDSTGRVAATNSVMSWVDPSASAPTSVNDHALREEIVTALKAEANKTWKRESSSQFVVIPAPGATYTKSGSFTATTTLGSPTLSAVSNFTNVVVGEGISGPGIPEHATVVSTNTVLKTATLSVNATSGATGVTLETAGFDKGFCGYHGDDASGSSYTFVAYPGEAPFNEGCISFDAEKNASHVTSMIASHEYAESATDPQVEPEFEGNGEWYTSNGYEIGDICASADSELPNGTWVQGIWDDHQGGELEEGKQREGCSLSDLKPPHVYALTEAPTNVTRHSAVLNGAVNPEGLETHYHLEYGTTTSYGTSTPEVGVSASFTNQHAAQIVTGASLEATYHYRIVATNSTGTTYGEDRTFTTTRWTIQTTPNEASNADNVLYGVSCTASIACSAAGRYYTEAGELEPVAERWNGTEWSIQLPPLPAGATGGTFLGISCPSATACTAVGFYLNGAKTVDIPFAEGWNGVAWANQAVPDPSPLTGAYLKGVSCTSSTACTAVGAYHGTGGVLEAWAVRWNGAEWTTQTTPKPPEAGLSELREVSCASTTQCIAAGDYVTKGAYLALIEKWNGTAWTAELPPNPTGSKESFLWGIACSSATACTAVGHYHGTGEYMPLAERWNGTTWTLQTAAALEHFSVFLGSVACPSASECTAVGVYDVGGLEGYRTIAEKWNGSTWSIEATPLPTGGGEAYLYDVSCVENTCADVGEYTAASGLLANLAEARAAGPYVETKPATGIGATEVTLNGVVNPEGAETKYYFEYGHTTAYGSKTAEVGVGAGTASLEESKLVTGLEVGAIYHFRIVAVNSTGTTAGEDLTVTPGWTIQATPNPEGAKASGMEGVSCTSASSCEGTGAYVNGSNVVDTLAEHWTGAKWEVQATPNPEGAKGSYLGGVACTAANACEAVGTYHNSAGKLVTLAEGWNGTKWEIQSTPNPEGAEQSELVHVACTSATACEAVGWYVKSAHYTPLAEVWNGTKWELQSVPMPESSQLTVLSGVSCASSASCEAVGYSLASGGVYTTLIEHWSGTKWEIQSSPNPEVGAKPVELESVACSSTTACEAAGFYKNVSNVEVPLAESWNGTEWKLQTPPAPGGAKLSTLSGVACSAAASCEAVGHYENGAGVNVTLAEAWNGSTWAVQPTPNPEGAKESYLRGVACTSATLCAAVGEYKNSSGTEVTLAEGY